MSLLAGRPERSEFSSHYAPFVARVPDGDMERVLAYRALHIARGNRAPIPGVEQDEYVSNSYAAQRRVEDLRAELRALRTSTVCLFASLPSSAWLWQGVIEGDAVSVRALAYIIVGHDLHHLQQLADRFGIAFGAGAVT